MTDTISRSSDRTRLTTPVPSAGMGPIDCLRCPMTVVSTRITIVTHYLKTYDRNPNRTHKTPTNIICK